MANTRLNSMTQQEEKNFFGSNPVLRNIKKSVGKDSGTEVASYKGITLKSLIFLAMILVGVVLASIIHSLNYQTIYLGEDIFATVPELIGSLVSAVLLLILSIVCIFLKKTIPFFGSLYCISFGYLYTSMANLFNGYREAILLAIVVTLSIFAAVVFAYMNGKIRVTSKFRQGVTVAIAALVISSVVIAIGFLIPGLKEISIFVATNPLLCIVFSIIGIIIATLSLVKDVDTIHQLVENKISAKFEWKAAFSLIFSLVWIFVEVLRLILAFKDN
ncbi:MAG: Bax inhibitor-1/YccA family protein [Candidatus Pseudoruminococcus sp.]|nr:Bax inhibitor-1/YccA family protein [Ruminococcus sp.]MDY2783098.1 Bax inhibitor-1/YccA family protein [Candidatus Pseudoruminococcus sp.]